MQNSQVYKEFIDQLNAIGSKKKDGYNSKLMEEIYDWEREVVEDIIWNKFVRENEVDLAILMPKLEKYDGTEALKKKIDEFEVPSEGSFKIAEVLYSITNENEYLRLIFENYNTINDKATKIGFVSSLSRLAKKQEVYDRLIDIYINDNDSINRLTALHGILWSDGYLRNIDDIDEVVKNIQLLKLFEKECKNERHCMIVNYKKGEFEHYKRGSIC